MVVRKIVNKVKSLIKKNPIQINNKRDLFSEVDKNSLLFFYGNNYSQAGQDGIIREIFYRLNIKSGYFIEFGGADGITISNCRSLYEKGFKAIFIEQDKKLFNECLSNYPGNDIIAINELVGAPKYGIKGKTLINLISPYDINLDQIQIVSIDVDGPDLEIFCEIGIKPPVVIIEGGTNFSPYLGKDIKVPLSIACQNNQQPFPYIYDQVCKNGYRIVCFQQDSYLVREDLADKFAYYDHLQLYKDSWFFHKKCHRDSIERLRYKNSDIKSLEIKNLGFFSPNPIGYE